VGRTINVGPGKHPQLADATPQKVPTDRRPPYNLKHWQALSRYCDDGNVLIENNHLENQIPPWYLRRSFYLLTASLDSGQRAAAIMGMIQAAKLDSSAPYACLKDVMQLLPTQRASTIGVLLPFNRAHAGRRHTTTFSL
jgi:hypothetical protein